MEDNEHNIFFGKIQTLIEENFDSQEDLVECKIILDELIKNKAITEKQYNSLWIFNDTSIRGLKKFYCVYFESLMPCSFSNEVFFGIFKNIFFLKS